MEPEGSTAETWVSDAWRSVSGEARLFWRTLRDYTRAPKQFTRAWIDGSERPMNPLGFLGTVLLIMTPAQIVLDLRERAHIDEQLSKTHLPGFTVDLVRAAIPYLSPILLSLCMYPTIALLRGKRSMTKTLGLVLYGAGPTMLLRWLLLPLMFFYVNAPGLTDAARAQRDILPAGATLIVQIGYLVAGASIAHQLTTKRALTAALLGFLLLILTPLLVVMVPVVVRNHLHH